MTALAKYNNVVIYYFDNSPKGVIGKISNEELIIPLIRNIIKETQPGLLLTIYEDDAHPTHQKVTELIKKSLNGVKIPLWFGEVWTPILRPNYAYYFNDELMDIKLKALSQYSSQNKRTDWKEAIKNLNRYRAITLGEQFNGFGSANFPKGKYAEVFLINNIKHNTTSNYL